MGRDAWNDEYAPDGWDYEKEGRPDVVYFRYSEGLSRAPTDVRGRFGAAGGGQIAGRRHVPGMDNTDSAKGSGTGGAGELQKAQTLSSGAAGVHPVDVTEDPQTEGRREGGFFVR